MKYGILMTIVAAGSLSFAQSSNMPANEVASEGGVAAPVAAPAETSSAALPAANGGSKSKWGGAVMVLSSTDVRDQQKFGSHAAINYDNYAGVNYAFSDKLKLEVGYNFSMVNSTTHADTAAYHNTYEGRDPQIILKQSLGKIGNSDPVAMAYSLYIPMGILSQEARGGNGTLRVDATTNYNVRKWTFSPFLSNRTYLGNSANAVSDTIYRFNIGLINTYNFSDALNVYYFPQTDCRSTALNSGKLDFNKRNVLGHEIGVNWNTKIAKTDVTVNPAFINYQDLGDGQGLGRNYYANADGSETNSAEIDLNLIATF